MHCLSVLCHSTQINSSLYSIDAIDEGSFTIPAIAGVIVGVAVAKVVSKGLDALFERSLSFNANKLEPILNDN